MRICDNELNYIISITVKCAFPLPDSIIKKPSDSWVTMTNTLGRWEISQSDDSSSWNAGTASAPHFSTIIFLPDKKTEVLRWLPELHRTKEEYLLSRMVGLFLWRILLNFPLKSLGGNGSRGKLAMRPRTTSSSPSEQSVSLSGMSLKALSSKDMLDGREPTASSIILPKESFEAEPGFPLFFFGVVFNFSLPFPSSQTLFFLLVGQQISAVQRCSQSCQLQSANVF